MALIADVGLLVVYAAVSAWFLRRYFQRRMMPSLWISLLPVGWILIGLRGMIGGPIPIPLKISGIVAGTALLYSVVSTDRGGKK